MTSAGRVLLIPKGKYDNSATYTVLDMVTENFSTYVARKTVSGVSPSSDTTEEYWMQMTGDTVVEQDVQDAFDYVFGTTENTEETTQTEIEVEQTEEDNNENVEEGGNSNE